MVTTASKILYSIVKAMNEKLIPLVG